MQQDTQAQVRSDLLPYNLNGQSLIPTLNAQYGQTSTALGTAFDNAQGAIPKGFEGPEGMARLRASPGYAFNLAEGMRALTNSNAAKGLGVSGNMLRGAANFATGLADSTYNSMFNQQQTQFQDQSQQFSNRYNLQNALYNQAYGPVALGETAAAQTGALATTGAGQSGANIAGAGQSLGTGQQAAGNALGSGIAGAGNAGINYLGAKNYSDALAAKAGSVSYADETTTF